MFTKITQGLDLNLPPTRHATCSDLSFRFHIGRDVADHAARSYRRCNWYVNESYLFETPLRRIIGTEIKPTNLRRCNVVSTGAFARMTY